MKRALGAGVLLLALVGPSGAAVADEAEAVPPHVTQVFPRDGAVDVTFVAGEGTPSSFTVVAEPGGRTAEVDDPRQRSVRVSGLTNGTVYRFAVRQDGGSGGSGESETSDPVVPHPASVPLEPTLDAVLPRDRSAEVHWNAPDDGGGDLTGYEVTAEPGGHRVDTGPDVTSANLDGLENGTAYEVTVRARNSAGSGEPARHAGLEPRADYAPGPPGHVSVVPAGTADSGLRVTWETPEDDGGSRITGYTVTVGDRVVEATGTSADIEGLDGSREYTASVVARNDAGRSAAAASDEPVSPAVRVGDRTVVLDKAAAAALKLAGPDSLHFAGSPAQVAALVVGDTVVAPGTDAFPSGALRKVTRAPYGEDGGLTVDTVAGDLAEALPEAEASLAGDLETDDVTDFRALRSGVRAPVEAGGDLNFGLALVPDPSDPGTSVGVQTAVRGQVSVDPSWELALKTKYGRPQEADFTATADVVASLDGKLAANATTTLGTVDLAEVTFAPVTVTLGPVPVVFVPKFTLSAKITAAGTLELAFNGTYAQKIGGRASYENKEWTTTDLTEEATGDFTADFSPNAAVGLEFPANLTLYLYDFVGPGISIVPYVTLSAAPAADPWATVDVGGRADLTFRVNWFDLEFASAVKDVSTRVWDVGGPLDGLAVENPTRVVPPGDTTALTAKRHGCRNGAPVVWSLRPGAEGTVDQDGTYHAPDSGSSQDTVVAEQPAEGLCAASRTTAVVQSGSTEPSAARNVRVERTGDNDLTVSWDPPERDGGAGAVEYAVVLDGDDARFRGHVEERTTDTSVTVRDRADVYELFGVTFSVIAGNDLGSGPATSRVRIPAEPDTD